MTKRCIHHLASPTIWVALTAIVISCSATDHGGDDTRCGTAEAATRCQSSLWPRLAVAFGDIGAASLSYAFVVDGKAVNLQLAACRGEVGESSAVHCDVGFDAYPAQRPQGRLEVGGADGGPVQLSVDIALQPFNYCGNGMAQIVISTGDGGMPTASAVTYLDACPKP